MVETRVLSSDVERLVVAAVINHDGAPIWVCLRFETRQHLVEPGRSVANRHYDANQGGTLLVNNPGRGRVRVGRARVPSDHLSELDGVKDSARRRAIAWGPLVTPCRPVK